MNPPKRLRPGRRGKRKPAPSVEPVPTDNDTTEEAKS